MCKSMRINIQKFKKLVLPKFGWLISGLILALVPFQASTQIPNASQVLTKSIEYHDPDGLWGNKSLVISLAEKRPNGVVRNTQLTMDLQRESFQIDQKARQSSHHNRYHGRSSTNQS